MPDDSARCYADKGASGQCPAPNQSRDNKEPVLSDFLPGFDATYYESVKKQSMKKNEYSPASEAILAQLRNAGLTPDTLMANWQVILWHVKVKRGEVKMKFHALGPVDVAGLGDVLQQALVGVNVGLDIQFKPIFECCKSRCEGCLAGNPAKQAEWIPPLLKL